MEMWGENTHNQLWVYLHSYKAGMCL